MCLTSKLKGFVWDVWLYFRIDWCFSCCDNYASKKCLNANISFGLTEANPLKYVVLSHQPGRDEIKTTYNIAVWYFSLQPECDVRGKWPPCDNVSWSHSTIFWWFLVVLNQISSYFSCLGEEDFISSGRGEDDSINLLRNTPNRRSSHVQNLP